ncbi:MAG: ExbD/TolR family protein [Oligoflexales bacterium]
MSFQINPDSNDQEDLAEINMVPLIDVMLVLLIVFMVAAPLSISGVKVNLPTSESTGQPVEEKQLVLSINKKGDYYLGKVQISEKDLKTRIKTILDSRNSKDLFIRADRKVEYEKVIHAMSAAKIAGVKRVGMLTENKGKG